ncbi:cyclohexanone monooxygenase [Lentinula aff. detonsa]|uniref:Cyclohexanone monooxygenase n=1 Tax=Lentinula aff. detonsa TaxID=2804958 RepID=A0AA38NS64_9AGAR|nr:cyclohexanone monooxygenase [Lentinula aff. detonsa]KAJ3801981.1 cyclohexanone monooxygenase [Lentinula aff. detonsa]
MSTFATTAMVDGQLVNSPLDILIVGAGFGGVYMLYHLRKLGYSVRVFEAASDLGGVWRNNFYPGARVDSEVPVYDLSLEELWRDWTWTERYPGYEELRRYFDYIDQKLDVKKDVSFNKRVVTAHFKVGVDRWRVIAEDGTEAYPRFLVICIGFAAKAYTPHLKGIERFQGVSHHTAMWPEKGLDLKGKRVGVIGTGASGVQVIQEIAKDVEQLSIFQRTPNFAMPMQQTKLDKSGQEKMKALYPAIFERRRETFFGYSYEPLTKNFLDATASERLLHFEEQWTSGGFRYLIRNYADIGLNQAANDEVYEFWKNKVRERLHDPALQEKLAPSIPPHPFGAKRPSLEQNYYEVYNRPNVDLIDLGQCPITEVTPQGILTADGVEHKLDVIIFATGFDSVTGGITQIDICGLGGKSIKDKWAEGVATNLGLTTASFPNMFFTYGPQAPTAFSNGPTCIEIQGDWIINCIKHMISNDLTYIDAREEAEQQWRKQVLSLGSMSLANKAETSWYYGSNIPGKVVEPYMFMGGVQNYDKTITEVASQGYVGFDLCSNTP